MTAQIIPFPAPLPFRRFDPIITGMLAGIGLALIGFWSFVLWCLL